LNRSRVQKEFEEKVVADTPREIEPRVFYDHHLQVLRDRAVAR
jgi:hypothetical protein